MTEDKALEAKKKRAAEVADFKWVASDARGQRVIRRILEQAGIYQLSFAAENTHATAFNEGRRNVGLFINDEILDICPEMWTAIMKGK